MVPGLQAAADAGSSSYGNESCQCKSVHSMWLRPEFSAGVRMAPE